jgi:hypothetical protein
MRYYSLVITDQNGNLVRSAALAPLGAPATYTSFVNGQSLANALNIELDISSVPYSTPIGAGLVRVWGIGLGEIAQASNLNGFNISVYGGMQKGLPLANPAQSGLLMEGSIQQAFGNWIGTSQTLDLILQPFVGEVAAPKNLVFNWVAGTPLADAIATTLAAAFPGYTIEVAISANLVINYTQPGYYQSLFQFASFINGLSASVIGGDYTGVNIVITGTTVRVYDSTVPKPTIQVAFQDLIGQPTWIDALTIQAKCVMRADIAVGDMIKLPPTLATSSAQSLSQFRNQSAFQGTFQVVQVRHAGNFRQPDAASWVTVINAVSLPSV